MSKKIYFEIKNGELTFRQGKKEMSFPLTRGKKDGTKGIQNRKGTPKKVLDQEQD